MNLPRSSPRIASLGRPRQSGRTWPGTLHKKGLGIWELGLGFGGIFHAHWQEPRGQLGAVCRSFLQLHEVTRRRPSEKSDPRSCVIAAPTSAVALLASRHPARSITAARWSGLLGPGWVREHSHTQHKPVWTSTTTPSQSSFRSRLLRLRKDFFIRSSRQSWLILPGVTFWLRRSGQIHKSLWQAYSAQAA